MTAAPVTDQEEQTEDDPLVPPALLAAGCAATIVAFIAAQAVLAFLSW